MRILLTSDPEIPVPPQFYGGVQRLVDSLLLGLRSRGHEVALVAHPDSTSPADLFFPWTGFRSQNFTDTVGNIKVIWQAVQTFKPDIIHSFSRLIYLLPVMTTTLPKVMSYGRKPSYRTVYWGAKLGGKSLHFAACSDHIRAIGELAGGNWQTIYNWIDIDKYKFESKVRPNAPLVFLSRVERIKGAHTAIEIAKRTGRRLLIAGNYSNDGEEGHFWRSEIVPHLGQNGIEYVGAVNDQQKNDLLGQALAMIVPIEWDEPFGMVFTESLACGTPVISCPRGALPEIVREGVDGFLINNIEEGCLAVKLASAIKRFNCRKRVEEHFSPCLIFEQYENLYSSMIVNHCY
jgi:glycosyltransferase involved in cell wall biosynthesis